MGGGVPFKSNALSPVRRLKLSRSGNSSPLKSCSRESDAGFGEVALLQFHRALHHLRPDLHHVARLHTWSVQSAAGIRANWRGLIEPWHMPI